ncbi:MAG: hypothetical protein HGA38_02115 [Candidatus Moranbacteria bacterium]|nr:hypothetical protein [Candidatus Moranbacteria bacterium]
MKHNRTISGKLLFLLSAVFFLWVLMNLVVWTSNDSRVIASVWSFFGVIYAILALLSLYFFRVFILERDVSFAEKVVYLALFFPVVILAQSAHNFSLFNIAECGPVENVAYLAYYHLLGVVAILSIIVLAIQQMHKVGMYAFRRHLFVGVGVTLFLVSFFLTSYLSSLLYEAGYSHAFEIEQYGILGMVFFMALLSYSIVKYNIFDIKLIGAQVLVVVLSLLVGSQFFFSQTSPSKALVIITLVLVLVFGYFLVRSVRREVERKEELQRISDSLAQANQRLKSLDNAKSEFISIASHQLRTPLTAIKGYLSLILEGSYGEVSREIEDVLEKVNLVNRHLIQLVEDLLNVSRIDTGRIRYSFEPAHSELIVADLADMFQPIARERGLELRLRLPKKSLRRVPLDAPKIREALSNLIDNAIKYTEQGSVTVSVEDVGHTRVRMSVADTGMGFEPGMAEEIFGKFVRTAETTKKCVSGTGLGLYVGRKFVEAHGGRMWAESGGPGTGSRFIIEIPYANPGAEGGSGEA